MAQIPLIQQQTDPTKTTRAWPVVPESVRNLRSARLNALMNGADGTGPTLADILAPDNFPFVETFSLARPCSHGVVVIKNIPFETTRAEVIAFLGRNSRILNDGQEPVHIIIDRVTSKTKDAYVEFLTMPDAMRAAQRHQATIDRGRTARLGDRPVAVELSSIDTLMAELFPHAWVQWQNGAPVIRQDKEERYEWRKFKGFITEEEMTMLVKHVEQPHRTPFSKDCPQRPYECMISTINKMPWYCGEFITIKQRNAMHEAVMKLLQHLHVAIQQRRNDKTLTPMLLKRLGTAAMACPGFSVVQKDNISVMCQLDQSRDRAFNQPRGASLWTHQLTLGPKERVPADMVEWYVAFIREESTKFLMNKPLAERNSTIAMGPATKSYFGYLWHELGFPAGKDYDEMTLRQAADIELGAMERVIRRAFLG
ncbi:hypothetical protein GQ53DRAFT_673240 [Thozetella sp. PMI_491]|nr:hypothetical protein GQ53DRAFT_673240 [Thozetella sp. PMI_491]